MPINDSTHRMGLNLIYHYSTHLINGNFLPPPQKKKSTFFLRHKRDGCFECGEVSHITILIQILLHSSPPIDINRTGKIIPELFLLRISSN
jgi:hypothetical protein